MEGPKCGKATRSGRLRAGVAARWIPELHKVRRGSCRTFLAEPSNEKAAGDATTNGISRWAGQPRPATVEGGLCHSTLEYGPDMKLRRQTPARPLLISSSQVATAANHQARVPA